MGDPAKRRLLSEVASASGISEAATKAADLARERRDALMVRAQAAGASYQDLQAATGLTRTGVYKALSGSVGGSLRRR